MKQSHQRSSDSKVFYNYSRECDKFLLAHTDNRATLWNCLNASEENILLQKEFMNSQIESLAIAKNKGTEVIAFANTHGKILLFNAKTQEQTILAKSHTGNVFDIKFNEESTHFYTISSDKKLFKFDLSIKDVVYVRELKRKNLLESAVLAPIKENIILAYENKLVLLNPQSDSEEMKFKGHSKSVTMIRVSSNANTHTNHGNFASYSEEGFINIYSTRAEKPIHSVSVLSQSSLVNIIFERQANVKNGFVLIAIHLDFVETWEFILPQSSETASDKSTTTTTTVTKSNRSFKLPADSSLVYVDISAAKNLAVAYGNNSNLQFVTVRFLIDGKFDFEALQDRLLEIAAKAQPKKSAHGVTAVASEKAAFIPSEKDAVETKNLQTVHEETEDKSTTNNNILAAVSEVDADNAAKNRTIDSAQSLALVLTQALHNNDTQLIDFCLEKDNEEMIDQSVRGMASTKVLILLDKLYDRLSSLPYKGKNLGKWLRAILRYHSTILITSPSAQLKLQPLMSLIENRTKNLDRLIGLRGKIDMVLALRRSAQQIQETTHVLSSEAAKNTPLVVYTEGDNTIQEEGTQIVVQKSKKDKSKAGEFSDSVSEDDSDEQPDNDSDAIDDESDVDADFNLAAAQKIKERLDRYKDPNFDEDDEDDIDVEEDESDFMGM